jgi:hypothetical protein
MKQRDRSSRGKEKEPRAQGSRQNKKPGPDPLGIPRDAPVSTGARKHLVDAKHVEGVHAHANVERLLADGFDEKPVAADTGSLECLRGQL